MTLKFKGGILIKYNVKCRLKNASIVVNIPYYNLLLPETGLLAFCLSLTANFGHNGSKFRFHLKGVGG